MADENISVQVVDTVLAVVADGVNYYTGDVSVFEGDHNVTFEILDNAFIGKTISRCIVYGSTDGNPQIQVIGANAFKNCTWEISTIDFEVGFPTTIKSQAFANCSGLTTINYYGTKKQWNSVKKAEDWNAGTPLNIICTDGTIIEQGGATVVNYLEPQNPIKKVDSSTGSVNYIYPLTTDKQVILEDKTRLNVKIAQLNAAIAELNDLLVQVQRDLVTAQNSANVAQNTADTHIANKSNPHGVTKAQIGLGNVTNVEAMPKANFSFSNGTLNIKL